MKNVWTIVINAEKLLLAINVQATIYGCQAHQCVNLIAPINNIIMLLKINVFQLDKFLIYLFKKVFNWMCCL